VGRRDRIIHVSAQIQRLRTELASFERELDLLLSPRGQSNGNGMLVEDVPAGPKTVWNQIVAYLEQHPRESFTTPSLATALRVPNLNTIRGQLSRLVAAGKIRKAARGMYTARTEEPENDVKF
jgi:hypothetical protein